MAWWVPSLLLHRGSLAVCFPATNGAAQALSAECHCRALAFGSRRKAQMRRYAAPLAFLQLLCSSSKPGSSATLHGMQVASLATRVISKWKEAVLAEQPSRKANKHRVTQPG